MPEASRWAEVDAYLTGLYAPGDDALDGARRTGQAAGLPPHEMEPTHGKLLHLVARIARARTALEIGTLAGYSTIWLARALPPDGRLFTLEADARRAEIARANVARAGLSHVVEVRAGNALDTLPALVPSAPFDLVFIDADKENNPAYLDWALRLSRPGTVIVADNVVRAGAVADPESGDPRVQGVRGFHRLLAAEPRVVATAFQTVSAKGYDGLALALVTAPAP